MEPLQGRGLDRDQTWREGRMDRRKIAPPVPLSHCAYLGILYRGVGDHPFLIEGIKIRTSYAWYLPALTLLSPHFPHTFFNPRGYIDKSLLVGILNHNSFRKLFMR
jgi:hypothetical protein